MEGVRLKKLLKRLARLLEKGLKRIWISKAFGKGTKEAVTKKKKKRKIGHLKDKIPF